MKKKIRIKSDTTSTTVLATMHKSGTIAITKHQWNRAIDRLISAGANPNRVDSPESLGLIITQN